MPVSAWLVDTMRHCGGQTVVEAGLWLREHCARGGKVFLTMAGAGSSFELGVPIGRLMRSGHIAGICVTGANLEESLYRFVANGCYAHIPDYTELTRSEEKELDRAGFRRITDTFLPEDESVRIILPQLEKLWREAEAEGEQRLWHEYFFELFCRNVVSCDPTTSSNDCWLHEAWRCAIPVFVPGFEDSTMGNIFAWETYQGNHPFLKRFKPENPIRADVVLPSVAYMHWLAEWYLDTAKKTPLAFVQLGGGIAGDFPICVVPHLKKDYLANCEVSVQDQEIPPWAGFIEIHTSPMSAGSYSGAGGKEKITWSKLGEEAYIAQVWGDYTALFPIITAILLER